jgi:glycosyltransferase involved in cell wall biosynthesis
VGAFQIPTDYQKYTVENLLPLAYMKYNPLFRSKTLIPVVADGLPYVYSERPEWYYNTERQGLKIPKTVKNFYLEEMRRGLNIIDGAIVISPLLKEYLSDIYEGPIEVCPPSISENKIEFLENIEPSEKPAVFSVVRDSEWKGLDILLEAFEIAREEIPDLELNLKIGDALYNRYEEKLQDDNINLHRKWLEPEDYVNLFSENQIYVQSSYFEAHGVAVSEAMCGGLTPLVTENVGAKHLLEEEFPELIREQSAEDLAEGIVEQINLEQEEKKRRAEVLRDKSKEVYPEAVKKKFRQSFQNLTE